MIEWLYYTYFTTELINKNNRSIQIKIDNNNNIINKKIDNNNNIINKKIDENNNNNIIIFDELNIRLDKLISLNNKI
jgi:hypothetical protein